jgi:CHAT domain-containing protein/tetratricopeptide (TPR) repeat protein
MSETSGALQRLEAATKIYLAGDIAGALSALAYAERAAERAGESGLRTSMLAQRAGWLRESGRVAEARDALQAAENAFAHLSGEDAARAFVPIRLEQAALARDQGDLAAARTLLEQAAKAARSSSALRGILSDVLGNLASNLMETGKYAEAQAILLEAAALDRELGNTRGLAYDLNMLGLLYGLMHDEITQERYLSESLAVARDAGLGKESAHAMANLAIGFENAGRLDEAVHSYGIARKAYEAIGDATGAADATTNLGIATAKLGDLPRADEYLRDALARHQAQGRFPQITRDLVDLAQIALTSNRSTEASQWIWQAERHATERGLISLIPRIEWLAARVAAANIKSSGEAATMAAQLGQEVLPRYLKAMDAEEILRLGIAQSGQQGFASVDFEELYGEAIFLAGVLRDRDLAFGICERSRFHSTLRNLGAARARSTAPQHPLVKTRDELTRKLLESEDLSPSESQSLLNELHVARARLAAEAPRIASLIESRAVDPKAIFAAIPAKTALIEFYIDRRRKLATTVATREGVASFTLDDLGEIDLAETCRRFRLELQEGAGDPPTGPLLFTLLFGRCWEYLDTHVDRLYIVPHGVLHSIPFAALWFENSGQGPRSMYLCHAFPHTVLPSGTFLTGIGAPPPATVSGNALVLGNPTGDLPGAAEEARRVAARLGVRAVLAKHATRSALLGSSAPRSVVHIASHGESDDRDPFLSRLLLADAPLTVQELLEAQLPTGLLSLSGCLTGVSGQGAGDQLVGLTQAASLAGARSVIATLWEIDDESAVEFFDQFYARLLGGQPKDMALLLAQRALMDSGRFSSARHWAPFVLLGDSRSA